MHRILQEIEEIIRKALGEHLPQVSPEVLEERGEVYYMNGKNGTEFDWHVNDALPYFMVFYGDKENLGAAKARVYTDGGVLLYLYGDNGHADPIKVDAEIHASGDELLRLAVCLRINADDKRIWDASIRRIASDEEPSAEAVKEFVQNRQNFEPTIRRMEIMGKMAFVSKRITEDGWKVALMNREQPGREDFSGWVFYGGNEDQAYVDDDKNFVICPVGAIVSLDPTVMKCIDSPVGAAFIRVSEETFEPDTGQPKVYMDRWKKDGKAD